MNKKYLAGIATAILLIGTFTVRVQVAHAESFDTNVNLLQTNQDNVTVRAEASVVTTADIAFSWEPLVCNSAGDITLPLHTNNTNPSSTEITSAQSMDYLVPETCLIRSNTSLNTIRIVSDDPTYSSQLSRQVSFSLPPTTSGTVVDVRDTNVGTTAVWVDVTYIANENRQFDATVATCATAGDITIPLVTLSSTASGQTTNVFGELVQIADNCLVRDGSTMNMITVAPDDVSLAGTLTATTQFILVTLPSAPVHVAVRYQDQMVYDAMTTIPGVSTFQYGMWGDMNMYTTSTVDNTVLTALFEASAQSPDFDISQLIYDPFYASFYIGCMNVLGTDRCSLWQYAVDGFYPTIGMDKWMLNGGENVNIYFADAPFRVSASSTSVTVNQLTTFTTERYVYDATDSEYVHDGNNQMDIATDPWDPSSVIATLTSDANGTVSYTFTTTGTFYAKVSSVDYSEWSMPLILIVSEAPVVATQTQDQNQGVSGGGSVSSIVHTTLNVDRAIEFLRSKQQSNGSILNSALYSDWTAIAYGAYDGANNGKETLKQYLLTDPSPLLGFNESADYARRSMALMALGVNPYTGTKTNYIEKLTSKFDGTQFGERSLINDDIFALVALLNAGYTNADSIVTSTTAYLISKQQSDGSWVDVDQTAAAVQALSVVSSLPNVDTALTKAKNYLHTQQRVDGSFGNNLDSSSWGRQAVSAFNESDAQWTNTHTLNDYIAGQQQQDGGLGVSALPESTRTWSTAYAITAALGRTWDSILTNVNKMTVAPVIITPVSGTLPVTTTTTVTSTIPSVVTSTPAVIVFPVAVETEEFNGTGGPENVSQIAPVGLATPSPVQAVLSNTITDEEVETASTDVALATDETQSAQLAGANQPAAETVSKPMSPVTKGAVAVTATAATSLGLFLAWKFLQGLV